MVFRKKNRKGWYTAPTLPGFGRVGPFLTGATSRRLADSIEAWLKQTALADPKAVKGIVDGAYTLREAYTAHGLGTLDNLRDAITDPPLAELVRRYERTQDDRRKLEGLTQLLEMAPKGCNFSWLADPKNVTDLLVKAKAAGRRTNSVHRSLYSAIKGVLAYHLGEAKKRGVTMEVKFRYEDDTRHVDTTPEQMAKLLKACDAELYDLAVGAVLTGIDQGPLLRMMPEHFDWTRQTVRVHDTKAKSRQRTIELSDDAAAHFRVLANNAKGGKLFHLNSGQIGRRWRQAREDAGLGDIRFKDLRHVFANAWVDDGGTIKDLGAVLGHTRASTTLRYTARQKAEARDRMGRVAERLGLRNPHIKTA